MKNIKIAFAAGKIAQMANPMPANVGIHTGTSSNPGCYASHPAPCLWSAKAVEDRPKAWDMKNVWATQRRLQALDQFSSRCYNDVGSQPGNGRSLFISLLLYVSLPFQ